MTTTKIGLGLAALGRPDYINIRVKDVIDKSVGAFKTNAIKVLDESYQLGIRDFDVAPSYGLGEEFLLEWNSSRNHSDVNLSTKFGYTYVANWNIGFSGKHEIKEHSLKKLNTQWQVSKAMLPNLKIYQIHSATLDSGVLNNTSGTYSFNRIVIPNEYSSGDAGTHIHKSKKLNYICSINPTRISSINGKVTNLDNDPIFSKGGRFILELVIIARED